MFMLGFCQQRDTRRVTQVVIQEVGGFSPDMRFAVHHVGAEAPTYSDRINWIATLRSR
ncbi:hypothetical protein [Limnohabitans sp. 2KL-1]|jgi:hypothetical protein|uniref:hypothetical protein n=1 Tax=Limnohabitans sp. 2KL-1 TaxID=1100699 RepID=UPI0013049EF2|nr:hypothetical protein [Limnohabitans sp. 2KL-1]